MDPAPDMTAHNAMVHKYKRLQLKHGDLVNDKQRLMEELAATQEVLDKLQAEADTLVELMHPLDPGTVLSPDYVQLHAEADAQDGSAPGTASTPYNDPSVPNHREYFLQYHPVNNGLPTQSTEAVHRDAPVDNHVAGHLGAVSAAGSEVVGSERPDQTAPQPV